MKYVPKAITRTVGRTVLKTQKNSPTLLFVAGVGGVVTAAVLACRATLKTQGSTVALKDDFDSFESNLSRGIYNQEEVEHEKRIATVRYAVSLSKAYAPAVVVGVISIGCLTKSHRQLTQRNAALTAAYVGLQNFLEGYRGRVREAIGEEKERDVYYAATPVELVRDGKNGPEKYFGSAPSTSTPYCGWFDEKNGNWQDSAEYNIHFIRLQEGFLTDQLRSQGHLFLNEVYDRLDIPRTTTGQQVGWFIGHPDSDDFVEIRITPMHDFHGTLMLDFNVAGLVFDMLDGERS